MLSSQRENVIHYRSNERARINTSIARCCAPSPLISWAPSFIAPSSHVIQRIVCRASSTNQLTENLDARKDSKGAEQESALSTQDATSLQTRPALSRNSSRDPLIQPERLLPAERVDFQRGMTPMDGRSHHQYSLPLEQRHLELPRESRDDTTAHRTSEETDDGSTAAMIDLMAHTAALSCGRYSSFSWRGRARRRVS